MRAPPAANAPPVEARKSAINATTIAGLPRTRRIAASFQADACRRGRTSENAPSDVVPQATFEPMRRFVLSPMTCGVRKLDPCHESGRSDRAIRRRNRVCAPHRPREFHENRVRARPAEPAAAGRSHLLTSPKVCAGVRGSFAVESWCSSAQAVLPGATTIPYKRVQTRANATRVKRVKFLQRRENELTGASGRERGYRLDKLGVTGSSPVHPIEKGLPMRASFPCPAQPAPSGSARLPRGFRAIQRNPARGVLAPIRRAS